MAKRFTDTNKFKKPFVRGLQGAYKLLWDYLCNDCDHAGIWIVDFQIAQICIGEDMPVNKEDALKFFNADEPRIIQLDSGKKWFIPSFIEFQYGKLSEKNRAHSNVISVLNKHSLLNNDFSLKINKPLTSPLQGAKEKEQEKEQEQEIEKGGVEEKTIPSNGPEIFIVPEMLAIFKKLKPKYIYQQDKDFPALRKIAETIADQEHVSLQDLPGIEKIKSTWEAIVVFILTDTLYKDFQLNQVERYFQAICSKFGNNNGPDAATVVTNPKTPVKPSTIQSNMQAAAGARDILQRKYANNGV